MFRRSELISIDYEDLEFVTEGVKILVKKSKTDQFGEGMNKGLPYFTNEQYCPVIHLKKWLDISEIKSKVIRTTMKTCQQNSQIYSLKWALKVC